MLRKVYEYIKDEEFRYTIYTNRIHIVNYESINSLSNDTVLVKTGNRQVKIKGRNLVLNRLLSNEALIVGEVNNIEVLND